MARDKYGKTLTAGDPVSIGDRHIPGTVRVAAVAQTCITVDWNPKDAYDSNCEGSLVEYWGPEEMRKWAEARDADMPKMEFSARAVEVTPPGPNSVTIDMTGPFTEAAPAPQAEAPKPVPPQVMTKRDAHPAAHPGRGPKAP